MLIEVSEQLKRWFEQKLWLTDRELLEKLLIEQLGDYAGGL